MGHQPKLVLLLLLAIGTTQLALAATTHSFNIVHDLVKDNELNSEEDADYISKSTSKYLKISTPKIKELPSTLSISTTASDKKPSVVATPPRHATFSDDKRIISDPIRTTKYHSVPLLNHQNKGTILAQSIKGNNDSASVTNANDNDKGKSEENYDLDDDDYNYDYYEDYNPDESTSTESTKKSRTSSIKNKSTSQKKNLDDVSKLKVIKEEAKPIPKDKKKNLQRRRRQQYEQQYGQCG